MNYRKPELHFISASMVDAVCVDGSVANIIQECTVGPGVTTGKCKAGDVPGNKCDSGLAASSCKKVGGSVGFACVDGNVPT